MSDADSPNARENFTPTIERTNNSRGMNTSQGDVQYSLQSSRSEGNISTTKRKKAKTPQSIEEIFNKVSVITSSNINPPPARVVLTPRSAEVCLKYGINPEVLKVRDIDSFWEAGIDPSVQRLRHEAYSQRRYELMKQCRLERKRLINAELNKSQSYEIVTETGAQEAIAKQQQDALNATIIENEKLRLEKLRRRQEKELEQMLQYELGRVKSQKDVEKRMQIAKHQEAIRQKQHEKRVKLMAEERRLKDLQRAAMAEAEESHAREVAKQMHERDLLIAQEHARKVEEQRAQLRREEEEKKRKYEEHKLQVQKFFSEQQAALNERLELMTLREQAKERELQAKQENQRRQLAEKKQVIEERIERNIQAAELMEKRRKEEYQQRQQEFEETRARHVERLELERRLKEEEQKLQEQRRRIIMIQQQREEDRKKEELLGKFEENEDHVREVQEMRSKEIEIMRERRNLRMQMKAENVMRVKRVHDYGSLKTLKKIEENDKRTERLQEERKNLIEQRKRTTAEARLQKEAMVKAMDALRADGSQADKVIKKVLNGQVSLTEIVASGGKPGDKKRRKSKKSTQSTSELLGLARTANSVYDESDVDLHTQLQQSRGVNGSVPLPYVSPYDPSFSQNSA